jgi:hypothetical protein
MLAQRHELKYFVEVETAAQLRRDLQPQMVKDPHCGDGESYMVNSLYFDTPDFEFFARKIDGQRYRHKIRLRTYSPTTCNGDCDGGNGGEKKVFLEMKKKLNNCIFKSRSSAPLSKVLPLLEDDASVDEGLFNGQTIFRGVDDIIYIAKQFQVVPSVGVYYRRRALMGKEDNRLRITFDEQVSSRHRRLGLGLDEKPQLLFDAKLVIMEIKVNNWLPLWLGRIVEEYNLSLRSISKYCYAVMAQNANMLDSRYS